MTPTSRRRSVPRRVRSGILVGIVVSALVGPASAALAAGRAFAGRPTGVLSGVWDQRRSAAARPIARTPVRRVLFADEFSGTELDPTKWQPNWLGGDAAAVTPSVTRNERACYDPRQVTVGDGVAQLAAVRRTCRVAGQTYDFASGMIQSAGRFTFTTGRLEARIFLPGTATISDWPALWTDGTGTWPSTGESDLLEGLGGRACWHYHSPDGAPGACTTTLRPGWHVIAEDVRAGTTRYFYDGVLVGETRSVTAAHFVVVNLGVGGPGAAVASEATMLVDYVRVTV